MKFHNVRFIIAAITTLGAYSVYVSRVNLSIAIIAMVDDGHHASNHKPPSPGEPLEGVTPASLEPPTSTPIGSTGPPSPPPDGPPNRVSSRRAEQGETAGAKWPLELANNNGSVDANATKHLEEPPIKTYFVTNKNSLATPLISQTKFHWDQSEQGYILGAFFVGYILFQIPGARMAESVGAKWIIMAASAGSAVISLVFPLSTQLNSIHLLLVLRFVMGLCQSAFFPAAYVLFCRWLPERERSVLLPIMFVGSNVGSISTYIMSSYLISSSYGWPSVFYASGLVCLVTSSLWVVFGSNGPEDNWLISERERRFIQQNVNNQSSERNSLSGRTDSEPDSDSDSGSSSSSVARTTDSAIGDLGRDLGKTLGLHRAPAAHDEDTRPVLGADSERRLSCSLRRNSKGAKQLLQARDAAQQAAPEPAKPASVQPEPDWPKLLTSIPVWTLILSMYGNEWSNVVLCFELPTYLNTALNLPIEQNGVINSFFQLSFAVASPIMSSLGAYVLDRHLFGMHKIHVRKLFQSLATFGQLACYLSVPICGANKGLIIMFMFAAIVFKSCANAGDIMVSGDLSPEYAGTIFALANSIGNTSGFFVPLLAGFILEDANVREQWTPFWVTTAAIMGFSGLIFLVFGETRRQDFSVEPAPGKPAVDYHHNHHFHHHLHLEMPELKAELRHAGRKHSAIKLV